jgi:hypothetical protein
MYPPEEDEEDGQDFDLHSTWGGPGMEPPVARMRGSGNQSYYVGQGYPGGRSHGRSGTITMKNVRTIFMWLLMLGILILFVLLARASGLTLGGLIP